MCAHSIVLTTPGYFASSRAKTYLVATKVYADKSCAKEIGAHTQVRRARCAHALPGDGWCARAQVLYCSVDTSVVKVCEEPQLTCLACDARCKQTFAKINTMKRIAVQLDSGFTDCKRLISMRALLTPVAVHWRQL
jgi:hypothetical protein